MKRKGCYAGGIVLKTNKDPVYEVLLFLLKLVHFLRE